MPRILTLLQLSGITVGYVRQFFGSDHTPWCCNFNVLNHVEIFWVWRFILDLRNSSLKKNPDIMSVFNYLLVLRSFQPHFFAYLQLNFGGNSRNDWHDILMTTEALHPLKKATRCGSKFQKPKGSWTICWGFLFQHGSTFWGVKCFIFLQQ